MNKKIILLLSALIPLLACCASLKQEKQQLEQYIQEVNDALPIDMPYTTLINISTKKDTVVFKLSFGDKLEADTIRSNQNLVKQWFMKCFLYDTFLADDDFLGYSQHLKLSFKVVIYTPNSTDRISIFISYKEINQMLQSFKDKHKNCKEHLIYETNMQNLFLPIRPANSNLTFTKCLYNEDENCIFMYYLLEGLDDEMADPVKRDEQTEIIGKQMETYIQTPDAEGLERLRCYRTAGVSLKYIYYTMLGHYIVIELSNQYLCDHFEEL